MNVGLDSTRESAGRYRVTVWREIETLDLIKRGGSWVIQGTDSIALAGRTWSDKANAMTALVRHYEGRA